MKDDVVIALWRVPMPIAIDTAKLMANWKTTANGMLAFAIATLTTLSGLMGATDISGGGGLHANTKWVIGVNMSLALCRAWVGLLQQDAGKQLAKLPDGQLANVPAHENPDDPANTPVVGAK